MLKNHSHTAWIVLMAGGAMLAASLLAWSSVRGTDVAVATAPTEQRLLTLTGTGSAQVSPDSATISTGVTATGSSADEAQDAASRRMGRLVAHMKRVGVTSADLQTSDASVYEDWEREGRFRANQSLEITVDDPGRAGALLAAATAAGADTVSGPSFGLEDQRAGYDEALRVAIADARAKADAAASHMGAEVRSVHSIGETNGVDAGPLYAATTAVTADGGGADVPVEEGRQSVTMNVEVSFTYAR